MIDGDDKDYLAILGDLGILHRSLDGENTLITSASVFQAVALKNQFNTNNDKEMKYHQCNYDVDHMIHQIVWW